LDKKKKHTRAPGYAKYSSRYKRVKSLLHAGYSVEEIYKLCSWGNKETNALVKEIEEDIINVAKRKATMLEYYPDDGIQYGTKDDFYYHPLLYSEDQLVKMPPKYTYSDLSEDEKEIYNVSNFIDGEWKAKHVTIQLYKSGFYQEEKKELDYNIAFYNLNYISKK